MKRIFATALLLMLSVCLLFGCSDGQSSVESTVLPANDAPISQLIDEDSVWTAIPLIEEDLDNEASMLWDTYRPTFSGEFSNEPQIKQDVVSFSNKILYGDSIYVIEGTEYLEVECNSEYITLQRWGWLVDRSEFRLYGVTAAGYEIYASDEDLSVVLLKQGLTEILLARPTNRYTTFLLMP